MANRTDPLPQQRLSEAMAIVADARARIAIYGSQAMVQALGRVADYPELSTRQACMTFVQAVRQMRIDTKVSSIGITDNDFSLVIFGQSIESFSAIER